MALPKAVDTQRDFSAGEIDPTAKRRDDDDFVKKGMRQLSNARILNTGGVTQRPGRNLIRSLATSGRVDDVTIAPGVIYRLVFTTNTLTIYDSTGTSVFTEGGRAWTAATVKSIVFTVFLKQVIITFPGVVPEVLTWDGATTWTSASYAETVTAGGQKRTPFYRISPQNITMQPSAVSGNITVAFSSNILVAGMIGTRFRYCDRQIKITGVTNGKLGAAIVQEPLPPGQGMNVGSSPINIINLGDVLEGLTSGAKGIVTSVFSGADTQTLTFGSAPFATFPIGDAVTGGTSGATGNVASVDPERFIILLTGCVGTFTAGGEVITGPHGSLASTSATGGVNGLNVQLLPVNGRVIRFIAPEQVSAPLGQMGATAVSDLPPQAVAVWDDEVMNAYRGWPQSVVSDQGRLIFCNFPSVPGAVAWSAIDLPNDLYVGANPADAFFELAPGKSQVLHVVPGAEGSEFVFTDIAVFYISITPTNPLRPGSVAFQRVSSDGAAAVQPRSVGDVILYVDQGLTQVQIVVATGAYNRPYESRTLTDLHSHLFNGIVAIALPTSVTQFPERYAYVLNGDGTLAVGKYVLDDNGKLAGKVGWLPWSGAGAVAWVSALNDVVLFTTGYPAAAPTAFMIEQLDATLYLDASLPVNAIPATLTPPGGKGPLWWLPLATVDLMDGRLPLGPHATDANGFLIPITPGEDLTSVTLRAGFTWTAIWEPFVLTSQGSQGADERMKKRRISRLQAYMMNSTGFRFVKIYSGALGPNLPAQGDIVSDRRIPAYNQDDDATLPPPLREQSYAFKPLGRAHDPRAGIIKDTPGPLTLVEMAAKASI